MNVLFNFTMIIFFPNHSIKKKKKSTSVLIGEVLHFSELNFGTLYFKFSLIFCPFTLFLQLLKCLVFPTPPVLTDTKFTALTRSSRGRSPREGNGTLLQYSCLENPMNRGSWGPTYSPWGCKDSDMTERLIASTTTILKCTIQYCLLILS